MRCCHRHIHCGQGLLPHHTIGIQAVSTLEAHRGLLKLAVKNVRGSAGCRSEIALRLQAASQLRYPRSSSPPCAGSGLQSTTVPATVGRNFAIAGQRGHQVLIERAGGLEFVKPRRNAAIS